MLKKGCLLLLWVILTQFTPNALASSLVLRSVAFKDSTLIPVIYTCEGSDLIPPLLWQGAPEKTQSFVIILDDPDAPQTNWTHWVAFNIPPNMNQLGNRVKAPEGVIEGVNSWGGLGYRGPCPIEGQHHYIFKLYALDTLLKLDENATKLDVLNAMNKHILGQAELVGLYARQYRPRPSY